MGRLDFLRSGTLVPKILSRDDGVDDLHIRAAATEKTVKSRGTQVLFYFIFSNRFSPCKKRADADERFAEKQARPVASRKVYFCVFESGTHQTRKTADMLYATKRAAVFGEEAAAYSKLPVVVLPFRNIRRRFFFRPHLFNFFWK